jgi:hypothetical protein
VLKVYGYRRYYNSIPSIIWTLRGEKKIFDYNVMHLIIDDFRRMSYKFDHMEKKRVYFPNLRYVCLTLMEVNGFDFGFRVEKIRTPRKKIVMESAFEDLY